jgi:serine/threonine protein kinase
MELMEGHTLDKTARGEVMPIDKAVDLGVQLADALDAAHERGIVHRDIKPANVFLTDRGQPKILDFGLAKVTTDSHSDSESAAPTDAMEADLTRPGAAIGTVSYMSPEQARGEELDNRTDIFSLGLVIYEMVTGQRAFSGNTSALIFDAILHKAPVAPVRLNPEVPQGLEQILNKSLEKDRRLRYQHASDLRADLERLRRDSDLSRSAVSGAPVAAPTTDPFAQAPPVSAAPAEASATSVSSASSDAQIAADLAKRHRARNDDQRLGSRNAAHARHHRHQHGEKYDLVDRRLKEIDHRSSEKGRAQIDSQPQSPALRTLENRREHVVLFVEASGAHQRVFGFITNHVHDVIDCDSADHAIIVVDYRRR